MVTEHSIRFQSAKKLANIDNDSIDLIVTSPPYPMIEMWDQIFIDQDAKIKENICNANGMHAFELMHKLLDDVWKECYRVLKPGGFACINIGDATRKISDNFRLYTNHSRITSFCESIGFQSLPAILWRKQSNAPNKFMGSGMLPSGAYVTLEHEYILILRKDNKRSFHDHEKGRRQKSSYFWEERNVWFSDLWDFKGVRQKIDNKKSRKRSAAFPFELAFRLINMYSMQDDVVLDPFMGTGTTLVAAIASARNSIGLEIDNTFGKIIDESIINSLNIINERQNKRILEHNIFVENYQRDKNKNFIYINNIHEFPVMTKQEINLTIKNVDKITKIDEGKYIANHVILDKNGDNQIAIEGFNLKNNSEIETQMVLGF